MELATLPLRLYQTLGIRRLVYALGLTASAAPATARHGGHAAAPAAAARCATSCRRSPQPAAEAKYRVGFFLGCAQNLLFADESAATVRVLARNGCTVVTPRETECCGMPARGYGRLDLVQAAARHNIAVFEQAEVDVIVTDCATCGSTLKEYGAILSDDPAWAARAEAFSRKVRDVSEFLAEIPLEKPQGRIEARVTYHDPCHLRRAQHVWKQPRALLGLIDGLEFVELPEADWCCGSAGSQLITHYETSLQGHGSQDGQPGQHEGGGHRLGLPGLPDAVEHRHRTTRA